MTHAEFHSWVRAMRLAQRIYAKSKSGADRWQARRLEEVVDWALDPGGREMPYARPEATRVPGQGVTSKNPGDARFDAFSSLLGRVPR